MSDSHWLSGSPHTTTRFTFDQHRSPHQQYNTSDSHYLSPTPTSSSDAELYLSEDDDATADLWSQSAEALPHPAILSPAAAGGTDAYHGSTDANQVLSLDPFYPGAMIPLQSTSWNLTVAPNSAPSSGNTSPSKTERHLNYSNTVPSPLGTCVPEMPLATCTASVSRCACCGDRMSARWRRLYEEAVEYVKRKQREGAVPRIQSIKHHIKRIGIDFMPTLRRHWIRTSMGALICLWLLFHLISLAFTSFNTAAHSSPPSQISLARVSGQLPNAPSALKSANPPTPMTAPSASIQMLQSPKIILGPTVPSFGLVPSAPLSDLHLLLLNPKRLKVERAWSVHNSDFARLKTGKEKEGGGLQGPMKHHLHLRERGHLELERVEAALEDMDDTPEESLNRRIRHIAAAVLSIRPSFHPNDPPLPFDDDKLLLAMGGTPTEPTAPTANPSETNMSEVNKAASHDDEPVPPPEAAVTTHLQPLAVALPTLDQDNLVLLNFTHSLMAAMDETWERTRMAKIETEEEKLIRKEAEKEKRKRIEIVKNARRQRHKKIKIQWEPIRKTAHYFAPMSFPLDVATNAGAVGSSTIVNMPTPPDARQIIKSAAAHAPAPKKRTSWLPTAEEDEVLEAAVAAAAASATNGIIPTRLYPSTPAQAITQHQQQQAPTTTTSSASDSATDPSLKEMDTLPFPTESALDACPCFRRNLPRFQALLQKLRLKLDNEYDDGLDALRKKQKKRAGGSSSNTLSQVESLIDTLEACTPMPPDCERLYRQHQWASMTSFAQPVLKFSSESMIQSLESELAAQNEDGSSIPAHSANSAMAAMYASFPKSFNFSTPLPPHPPIAILLEVDHITHKLHRMDTALDPSVPLSPKWLELKLVLLRLFSMPGIDPSRIYIFTPTLPKASTAASSEASSSTEDDKPTVRVPAWFSTEWLTYESGGIDSLTIEQLSNNRLVQAFKQVHIVDVEQLAGEGWQKEQKRWNNRLDFALASAANYSASLSTSAQQPAPSAFGEPNLNTAPVFDGARLRRQVHRQFNEEYRQIRKNLFHWNMFAYFFDIQSLLAPNSNERSTPAGSLAFASSSSPPSSASTPSSSPGSAFSAQQRMKLQKLHQEFSAVIMLDPQSLPSLDWLQFFRNTQPFMDEKAAEMISKLTAAATKFAADPSASASFPSSEGMDEPPSVSFGSPKRERSVALVSAGGLNEFSSSAALKLSAKSPSMAFNLAIPHILEQAVSDHEAAADATQPPIPAIATLSSKGLFRSTGWSSQLVQGGSWMLSRHLYEQTRSCFTCWNKHSHAAPVTQLPSNAYGEMDQRTLFGSISAARSDFDVFVTSDNRQESMEKHRVRMSLQRETRRKAQEALASAQPHSDSWFAAFMAYVSSDAQHPSSRENSADLQGFAPASSSLTFFNRDPCHLNSWDEPFARLVSEHNSAVARLDENLVGSTPSNGGAPTSSPFVWLSKSLEVLQPYVPRIHRLSFRVREGLHRTPVAASASIGADTFTFVRDLSLIYDMQLKAFMPDQFAWPFHHSSDSSISSGKSLNSLTSAAYQQDLYSRFFNVNWTHVIASKAVHPIRYDAELQQLLPDEIEKLRASQRAAEQTRLRDIDEEVVPHLLSILLSPASLVQNTTIVLVELEGTSKTWKAASTTANLNGNGSLSPGDLSSSSLPELGVSNSYATVAAHRMWSMIAEGLGLTFSKKLLRGETLAEMDLSPTEMFRQSQSDESTASHSEFAFYPFNYPVHHGVFAASLGSASGEANLFFVATSSIYVQRYGIAKNNQMRGVNYATLREVFEQLGSMRRTTTAVEATILTAVPNVDPSAQASTTAILPAIADPSLQRAVRVDGGRAMLVQEYRHRIQPVDASLLPVVEDEDEKDPDDIDPAELERIALAAAEAAAKINSTDLIIPPPTPKPEPPAEYTSSVLFPSIPPIDTSWHQMHNCLSLFRGPVATSEGMPEEESPLPYKYNVVFNTLTDASNRKLQIRPASKWNVRIPNLHHTVSGEHGWQETPKPMLVDPLNHDVSQQGIGANVTESNATISQSPSPQPEPFASDVCLATGSIGESCREVCENLLEYAPTTSLQDTTAIPASSTPTAPSLLECSAVHFPLLHTFPVYLSTYFPEFDACRAVSRVHMQGKWNEDEIDATGNASVDSAGDDSSISTFYPSFKLRVNGASGRAKVQSRCAIFAPALYKISQCDTKPPVQSHWQRVCPCRVKKFTVKP